MKFAKFFLVIVLLLYFISNELFSQKKSQDNNNDIKVSLLTYSPGSRLYSVFGHSAIRIYDQANSSDLVYNYGTFQFDQSGFYLKFLHGNLIYSLSRTSFENVKQSLILENRSLIETPLVLNNIEKVRLIRYLENNILPENRDYRYDFLYDNCATRIIELLKKSTSDSLIIKPEVLPVKTFRQLLRPYLKNRPWVHMGIDLLMGIQADKMARLTEPAFLPDYLHLFVKNFQLQSPENSHRLSRHDIIHFQSFSVQKAKKLTPSLFLWPLCLILLISALIDSHFRLLFQRIGNIILLLTGVISLLLYYLWIFPDHSIFRYNIDLLWAHPLLLLAAFMRHPKTRNRYTCLKIFFLLFTGIMATLGILVSIIVERNLDLTALGMIVLIILTEKLKSIYIVSHSTSNS